MRPTEAQIRRTVRGILREGFDPSLFEENGKAKLAFVAAIDKFLPAIVKMLRSILDKAVKDNRSLDEALKNLMSLYDDFDLEDDEYEARRDIAYAFLTDLDDFVSNAGETDLPELRFIANIFKRLGSMSATIDVDIDTSEEQSNFRQLVSGLAVRSLNPGNKWQVKELIIAAFKFPVNMGLIPLGQGEEAPPWPWQREEEGEEEGEEV